MANNMYELDTPTYLNTVHIHRLTHTHIKTTTHLEVIERNLFHQMYTHRQTRKHTPNFQSRPDFVQFL